MKLQYLIEILFILLSRSKVSAKYLADRFGISIRSVYRYIDELSLIVPIYNTRGRNGGYSISETYKIPASFFTVEESEILTGILFGITDELNSQALTKILEKIKSISKKGERQTSINFENLIIDGGPWGDVEGYKELITFFEECIEKLEIVHIGYRDRDGNLTERDFEPHALMLKQGLWYVYGYCLVRNEFRLFKVGRIEKANKISKNFTRRSIENLRATVNKWYDSLQTETVDLIISDKVKEEVEEWLGVDKIKVFKDQTIHATFNMPVNKELIGKILSFGSEVKVVSPKSLEAQVKSAIKDLNKLYN